ncbi:hypothetical protein JOD54_002282 [Actinokineospora baliensis]|uniref:peptidase inhibitor family I36 protein n=1 Tax=Actinokineospora baliensis TaxID=547056 RepID=UPI0027DC75A5|nr:peptidase inhibitor family I36 protein [Actinokineospora baliensis]MBM7772078.1 hypothetical protein [Actinokineospora baliensis]
MLLRVVVLSLVAVFGLAAPASASVSVRCDRGELCVWSGLAFRGESGRLGVGAVAEGECLVLGRETRSLVNLLRREVTVYESAECATAADFTTYPGMGTYVPATPFVVRAIQVWPA